jgi:hypothetical protein
MADATITTTSGVLPRRFLVAAAAEVSTFAAAAGPPLAPSSPDGSAGADR